MDTIYRTFETMQVIQDHDKPPVTVEIHRRATVRELIAKRWDCETGAMWGYYNNALIWRDYITWQPQNDIPMPIAYAVRTCEDKVYHVDLDAEIILSYREPGVWLRLTDEARAVLVEIANGNHSNHSLIAEDLADKGYLVWRDCGCYDGDEYAAHLLFFLTYEGARIIPPESVRENIS